MILRLAHVDMGVRDLDIARRFYVERLGLIEEQGARDAIYLRAIDEFDRWSLRLSLAEGPGVRHVAFRVSCPDDLDDIERVHDRLGLPHWRVIGAEPGIGESLRVSTEDGLPVEFVHDIEEIDLHREHMVRLAPRQGPLPGPGLVRLDHVNVRVRDLDTSLSYWRDRLHFSISEMVIDQQGHTTGAWLRRKSGTHDIGFGQHGDPFFHHVAFYLRDSAAIISAADLFGDLRLADHIERGPGRHGVTNALFLYVRDPFGNRIELYHGDYARDLDRPPVKWSVSDFKGQGSSWWGQTPPESWSSGTPFLSAEWHR